MGVCDGVEVERLQRTSQLRCDIFIAEGCRWDSLVGKTEMRTFNTSISFSILALFSRSALGSRCRFAMRCLSKPFATFRARDSAVLWCSSFS